MGLFIISIATRPRVQIDDEVRVKSYVFGTMRPPPPPPPKKGKLHSFLVQSPANEYEKIGGPRGI